MDLIKNISTEQWALLVLGVFHVAEFIVRLTPTEKDDSILNTIKSFVDTWIPNLKKGGGKF